MNLRDECERCWPWLDDAIKVGGARTHYKEHIWSLLVDGKAFLFPGRNCALLGEIFYHPSGLRSGNGWLAGGSNLTELCEEVIPRAEEFALQKGCHRLVVSGRHGWVRVLEGYRDCGWKISKTLIPSKLIDDKFGGLGSPNLMDE